MRAMRHVATPLQQSLNGNILVQRVPKLTRLAVLMPSLQKQCLIGINQDFASASASLIWMCDTYPLLQRLQQILALGFQCGDAVANVAAEVLEVLLLVVPFVLDRLLQAAQVAHDRL